MAYKVKSGTPKKASVHLMKPRRVINLDTATKAELKMLFDIKHPYIEKV